MELVGPDFHAGFAVAPFSSLECPQKEEEDGNGHDEGCCRGERDDQQAFLAHVVLPMLCARHGYNCTQIKSSGQRNQLSLVNYNNKIEYSCDSERSFECKF